MKFLLLLTALVSGTPIASEHSIVDEYPRRDGIDIENYRFELHLSDETDVIVGRTTVSVRFTNNSVTELPLDLVGIGDNGLGMAVSAVSAKGIELLWAHEADLLTIALPETGRTGVRIDVDIEYSGIPDSGLVLGPNRYGDRTFFSDNWPNRARNWLPTIDHPYDKAMNEMVVTAPSHYQVVSNGILVEQTDSDSKTRTTHWKNSVPIATWLYVLGVAEFAVQHYDDFLGRPLQTWVYRQDREKGFYDFAVPTKAAMAFYNEYVGPYAYEKLANITSPVTGGGMEAATAIMYHESSVNGERSVRWRNVIIHEVAHQWFGNAVTQSDWDDVWLSEGFATYFTLLFIEHAYGRDEFVIGLRDSAERVFAQYEADPDYRIVHDGLSDMGRVTSRATYQKGSWILHMLRNHMGDADFWSGIQSYYNRYMNGNATTSDFRSAMEEASGLDLRHFFQQWLYSGGNPRLEGWWDYDAERHTVQVEIHQTQTTGPTFQLSLDIGLHFEGSTLPSTLETFKVDERSHRFTIPVESEPTQVTLDPNVKMLFESEFGRASEGAK